MELTVEQNKVCKERQNIRIENHILTLIGENGSGKSAILESIFKNQLQNDKIRLICFSSGQNESFSKIYFDYIDKARKTKVEGQINTLGIDVINSFYFDYNWSKILIFFATALKKDGLVRTLLKDNYIQTNEFNDDISTQIQFSLTVGQVYINRIIEALKEEENEPFNPNLRKTDFHTLLGKLIEAKINKEFSFSIELKKTKIELKSNEVVNIFNRDIEKIFTFFSVACNDKYFIDLASIDLRFKNNLGLNDLSDGEYQLLVIYSILDLFDTNKTLFLFDEIDSHLYYKNITKLWSELSKITGNLITTSHIADSIVQNDYTTLKLVESGKVIEGHIAYDLLNRLNNLSESSEYVFKIASKIEYLVLVEDEFDWFVFKELAKIKLGNSYDFKKIDKIQVVKCSSGYSHVSQVFGDSRIKWVTNFNNSNSIFKTNSIFMLCDRDDLPIGSISLSNGVQVTGVGSTVKFNKNRNTAYMLSWKRREIENYLLSYSCLKKNGILESVNYLLGEAYKLRMNDLMDNEQVQNIDVKKLLQPLYISDSGKKTISNPEGVDYEKLLKILSDISASEISVDIENMHNFIVSKIN